MNDFEKIMGLTLFWGAYGLFWIHSVYPNYKLADVTGPYGDGYSYKSLVFDTDTAENYSGEQNGRNSDLLWDLADAHSERFGPLQFLDTDGFALSEATITANIKESL